MHVCIAQFLLRGLKMKMTSHLHLTWHCLLLTSVPTKLAAVIQSPLLDTIFINCCLVPDSNTAKAVLAMKPSYKRASCMVRFVNFAGVECVFASSAPHIPGGGKKRMHTSLNMMKACCISQENSWTGTQAMLMHADRVNHA
jgi:hypothetical protein